MKNLIETVKGAGRVVYFVFFLIVGAIATTMSAIVEYDFMYELMKTSGSIKYLPLGLVIVLEGLKAFSIYIVAATNKHRDGEVMKNGVNYNVFKFLKYLLTLISMFCSVVYFSNNINPSNGKNQYIQQFLTFIFSLVNQKQLSERFYFGFIITIVLVIACIQELAIYLLSNVVADSNDYITKLLADDTADQYFQKAVNSTSTVVDPVGLAMCLYICVCMFLEEFKKFDFDLIDKESLIFTIFIYLLVYITVAKKLPRSDTDHSLFNSLDSLFKNSNKEEHSKLVLDVIKDLSSKFIVCICAFAMYYLIGKIFGTDAIAEKFNIKSIIVAFDALGLNVDKVKSAIANSQA